MDVFILPGVPDRRHATRGGPCLAGRQPTRACRGQSGAYRPEVRAIVRQSDVMTHAERRYVVAVGQVIRDGLRPNLENLADCTRLVTDVDLVGGTRE